MKNKTNTLKHTTTKNVANLFRQVEILLIADLCDPKVEANAREILGILRKRGYSFMSADLEDPQCIPCLFLALQSAADLGAALSERKTEKIH